ncbi:MAG: replicative DNA helicase [Ignavibacteria bacterium]|nr:replicative DNA helicase [Ignavibacteria bacterium]
MAKNYKYRKVNEELLNEEHDFGAGLVPPSAPELENTLLGAILIDNEVLNDVLQLISHKHFYKKQNSEIFRAIENLNLKNEPVDANTLIEELKKMNSLNTVGGREYIIEIASEASSSANVSRYARIILEKYILRNLINLSGKIIEKSLDPTVNTFNLLDTSENELLQVSEFLSKKKVISVAEEMDAFFEELGSRKSNRRLITGVPTGFTLLDDYTSGFQSSELIIIAGRPSHGKTAFALNIARNAAVQKEKKVAIFSIEMSYKELLLRLLSSETGVNARDLKTGRVSPSDWKIVQKNYHKLKTDIFIDDSSELSILELRAKARRLHYEHKLDMIIVDYLQLVKGQDNPERRDLEVAYVSRGLKALAKDLNIPVVACAQLNRGVESRSGERKPQLADLRESGSIEQDADVVIFVHRPGMSKKKDVTDDPDELKKIDIIIGKQRNGPVGDFDLIFEPDFTRFTNKIPPPVIPEMPGDYDYKPQESKF